MNVFEFVNAFALSASEIRLEFLPFSSELPVGGIIEAHISLRSDFSLRQEFTVAPSAEYKVFSGLNPSYYYYMRVRNIKANNAASDWQLMGMSTQQEDGYSTQAPRRPLNVQYNHYAQVFSWGSPLEGYPDETGYVLQISKLSSFTNPIIIPDIPANSLSYNFTTYLQPSTRYYARLAAVNMYGYSPWSSVLTWVTLPLPTIEGEEVTVQGSLTSSVGDFLRDGNGALVIQGGDLVVGDATQQHQKDIVVADKGWNHFYPLAGVGLQKYLNDTEGLVGLRQAIRFELERDGQLVEKVEFQKGSIQILAQYD